MRVVGVCSGVGGMELAGRWAGWRIAGMCEIDPWCRGVLAENFPGVPVHDDLWTLTPEIVRGWLAADAERQQGGQRHDPDLFGRRSPSPEQDRLVGGREPWLLCGGIPCQPFSVAGQQRGVHDPRHLWPAVAGLVRGLGADRPDWVLVENVRGFVRMALDDLLADLDDLGYASRAVVVPAAGVGAIHLRERVWVVARAVGVDANRHGQLRRPEHGS